MVSHSGGLRGWGWGGTKIKIEMLIALLLIQFSSNSPSLVSQQQRQEDIRKKARCSVGLSRGEAEGHTGNFTPKQDQQHRGGGVSSKTNKWKGLRDKMGSNR